MGPLIGRVADRIGRKRIIPLGILIAALCCAALIPRAPLLWPAVIIAILSLGYDMSHPLLAGIVTSLNPSRRGLAMGMNAFCLFCGFGLGPLAFELLLKHGFRTALAVFAVVQLCLAILAVLDAKKLGEYTEFAQKFDAQNNPTPLYRGLVEDRARQVGVAFAGTSENALYVQAVNDNRNEQQSQELLIQLAQNILSFTKVYGENTPVAARYFASFTQIDTDDRAKMVQNFVRSMDAAKEKIKTEKGTLKAESDQLKGQGQFLDTIKQQRLELLTSVRKTLDLASAIVKRNTQAFAAGGAPLTPAALGTALQSVAGNKVQTISLQGRNPYVDQLSIDWSNEKISLTLYPDVAATRQKLDQNPAHANLRDQADQLLYNEIAMASRQSGEEISPFQNKFEIALSQLNDSKSFLALKLSTIAASDSAQLVATLKATWHPKHPDLSPSSFPIYDYETFINLPASEQSFGLVIYAPALHKKTAAPQGFHMNSIYVIAKGMDKILQRMQNETQSQQTAQFIQDFNSLRDILQRNGFVGYSGGSFALSPEYAHDFIFEGEDYYQTVLKATREDFTVYGSKRYAVLEFTDVEQRILDRKQNR